MCGGTDLVKKEGTFECQSCGSKYSVEEARKMMVEGTVEVTGKVTVDNSAKLDNLYKVARRAHEDGNTVQAAKYYEQLQLEDPDNWETNFYTAYYSGINSLKNDNPGSSVRFSGGKVNLSYNYRSGISSCIRAIYNSLDTVFSLIEDIQDYDEQKAAINAVEEDVMYISSSLMDIIEGEHQRMKSEISHFVDETEDNVLFSAMTKSTMGGKNNNIRDDYRQDVSSMVSLVKKRKNRIEEIETNRRYEEEKRREKEYWDSLSEEARQEVLRKREEEVQRKREEEYYNAVKELDEGLKQFENAKDMSSVSEYEKIQRFYSTLANKFDTFGNFKDAMEMSKKCHSKINFCMQEKEKIEAKIGKTNLWILLIFILTIVFFAILFSIIS